MADSHAKHGPSYMTIFWYLAILTVVEIAVIFLPIAKMAIAVMLISLATASKECRTGAKSCKAGKMA